MVSQYYRNSTTATATASHGHSNGALCIIMHEYIHEWILLLTTTYIYYNYNQLLLPANNKAIIILASTYMYWQTDLQTQTLCMLTTRTLHAIRLCIILDCVQSGRWTSRIACNPAPHNFGLHTNLGIRYVHNITHRWQCLCNSVFCITGTFSLFWFLVEYIYIYK
jgi:hypothetical protein